VSVVPIQLSASSLRLRRGGGIRAERDAQGSASDDWRLTVFHAKTAEDVHSDHWEVHPDADEVVSCLIGKIRLCLRAEPAEAAGRGAEEVRLPAGTAAIVPRGRWHRIELDVPSSIMTVTVPRGSRLEQR
jgi:mannose-6-phosphate isomerase-like protein (cupin superfamily)